MEDRDIVTLYWQRDQEAIRQTDRQYGRYLSSIAFGILADREDSRETVNDTYLRAWDSMPPHRPQVLPPIWAASPGSCPSTDGGPGAGPSGAGPNTPCPWRSWGTACPALPPRRRPWTWRSWAGP